MPERRDVTVLLTALSGGDRSVLDRLVPAVYEELRALARHELRREATGHTLNTTGLVHEAYVKLAKAERLTWKDRAHFFSVCAQAMRRVLVDHARARGTGKRGRAAPHVSIDDVVAVARSRPDELLWIDAALERLEALNARQSRVVECRAFGGMGVQETATAMGISSATVKRDWTVARAWLNRQLELSG
jgi:RNA polymerase sigma factor (TIGR02999 family)